MYCLTDFVDYASLQEPLKHSSRIKYTCFDVSQNLIVLGSSAGSLYIFNEKAKFLHLVPNGNYQSVTKVQISPNEKYVAFSQRSIVCLYVINLSAQATPQVIVTHLKSNQQVSYLRWTKDSKHFYCGDTFGQVNLVMLSSFIGSNLLLNMTVHPLLFLETPIVQLDDFETLLLVSTQNKCILCNTDYEEYKQIGTKPRTGAFGACFWISSDETTRPSRIYCARPGSRFWEADFEGDVISTHQFKTALAVAPAKIHKPPLEADAVADNILSKYEENDELLDYMPQQLQFEKIQMLEQGFLLAFTELGLYIFDMVTSTVVLWCNQFERINDCKVIGDKIVIFTQTGSLCSVKLRTCDALACTLVQQERLLESACLMRKNVKYFADKAREDYELRCLNRIKNFLIERQEYEMLNDLSVIFDAIAQCEGNGDNQSSGGSSTTAERSLSVSAALPTSLNSNPKSATSNGVYVLENSFCDNSKQQARSNERHLKDALLTVTGKFGKNIIKYKFNIFAEEQQKLVKDLLPANERSMPFRDINTLNETEEEIVCRAKKPISTQNRQNATTPDLDLQHISAEEKTIYNLYLICKSSQIGNTKFVERYRKLFDEYTARELIDLLKKLENLMIEHGDSSDKARRYCYEMYFNYLDSALIWEVDEQTRGYITAGFILINSKTEIERCEHCQFPLRFDNSCLFYELGAVLLRYYWSRNEQVKCFDILNFVPALFDILAKLYLVEGNLKKVLPIIICYGKPELLQDIGKNLNPAAWMQLFELFKDVHLGHLPCVNCDKIATVDNINRHFFYTWNCFMDIALENLSAEEVLNLIYKWSSYIPNNALDREFFVKCLLK